MTDIKNITKRITRLCSELIDTYPFFGRLLLRLKLGFDDCGTAYTDMERVVFDPRFADSIGDDELKFVLLHEVMHCVLNHCTRSVTLNGRLYNIACDIVVNSLILDMFGKREFSIKGKNVMHLAPNGCEGRDYTAEEIYKMMLSSPLNKLYKYGGFATLDIHDSWQNLNSSTLNDAWRQYVYKAAKGCGGGSGIPAALRRYIKEVEHAPHTNWRQILHDYIQHNQGDYTYLVPDSRYSGDIIMPSFRENMNGAYIENLWFFVDTSASVTDRALGMVYSEIRQAVEQIDSLCGMLSFFDSKVSAPQPFETVEELINIEPVGGGGTSFAAIFEYIKENCNGELPRAVVIMTDGYAPFPSEESAMDIPVIWIIVDSDVQPEWGECVHIYTK